MDIKKKADELAQKFQTRNPFEIIQGLNVILVFPASSFLVYSCRGWS